MRFHGFRTLNFRNFSLLQVTFPPGNHFIRGRNGQGKTNLLEALGFATSLRSFRTTETTALLRWDARPRQATLVYEVEHPAMGETVLEIQLQAGLKRVLLDGNPVRRLGEIIGQFPTVTFSSHDIQILRGSPALRRRVMDMMFVVMEPSYLEALTRYFKALKSRNVLLKERSPVSQRRPFDELVKSSGWELTRLRAALAGGFQPLFREAYREMSDVEEDPDFRYVSSGESSCEEAYADAFEAAARRDEESGTTMRGPHRDDFSLRLQDHVAKDFASEGQQRGLVLALRMGLVKWYRHRQQIAPVILADDIVGELDTARKRGFWRMLGTGSQVIATGTAFPEEHGFTNPVHWKMESGRLVPESREASR